MKPVWRTFLEKPVWFTSAIVMALVLLPVAVWLDLRNLSDRSLESQASDLNNLITDIRGYYSRNVVGRVIGHDGTTVASHDYAFRPGAIPIPATLSLELGDVIGARARNIDYRFVSDQVFEGRLAHNLDRFEREALAAFRRSRNAEALVTEIDGSIFDRQIRIAAPVVMGATCVECHNSHPQSPSKSWSVGDIRGIQAITIDQPIAENLFSFRYLLLYFAGAGAFGAAFAGQQRRQARRFKEMNQDLECANAEIVDLNSQLHSENVRLGAELDVARRIQKMVLPAKDELDRNASIEIAGYMEPADEVGGDYYDVLQNGRRVKIGIGDVTGHGLESGVLMLMVQSVALALQERGVDDPKQFLTTLNSAIYRNIARTHSDKHLTLSFLDYEDRTMTLSGQHEDVLVLRSDGTTERIDTMDLGFPVGLDRDISDFIMTRDIRFSTGDIIVLHTDGVTEAEDAKGELFGFDRFAASAEAYRSGDSTAIVQGIMADLKAHIGSQRIHDDITLVVLRHR